MPHGDRLLRFANSAHQLSLPEAEQPTGVGIHVAETRSVIEQTLGLEALHEAAATVAVFNGLVRVADGTGIQVDAGVLADSADFRPDLGVDDYAGAANTETAPIVVDRSSVSDLFA